MPGSKPRTKQFSQWEQCYILSFLHTCKRRGRDGGQDRWTALFKVTGLVQVAWWIPTQIPSLFDCKAHVLNWIRLPALPALNAMLCIFLKLLINARSKSGTELELGLFYKLWQNQLGPPAFALTTGFSPPQGLVHKGTDPGEGQRPLGGTAHLPLHPYVTPSSHPASLFSTLVIVVWLLSCVYLSVTPWTAACQASLSLTISLSLLKLMSIESVMPSNHLILCCPLLLLPSIFPSIRFFSNEWALHIRWPKHWSFSFSIHPLGEKNYQNTRRKKKEGPAWLHPPTHDVAHPRVKHKAHGQPGGSNLTEASPLQGEPSPGLLSHPSLSQQQNTCICFLLHPLPEYTEQTEAAGPLIRERVLPGLVPSRTAPFLRSPGEGRHLYPHFNFFFFGHTVWQGGS